MGFLKKLFGWVIKPLTKWYKGAIDSKDRHKIKERTQTNSFMHRLKLDVATSPDSFSFLVVGDSGHGGPDQKAKTAVADAMWKEVHDALAFTIHVGDVVYMDGAKEGYPDRFIRPYRQWLKDSTSEYHGMVFEKAFLPIYGNHDYYDFPDIPVIGDIVGRLSDSIGSGSHNGKVFEEAFVQTKALGGADALDYIPGDTDKTRIPNRYYWFTYGDCAFIGLDSNTLDGVEGTREVDRDAVKRREKEAKKRQKKHEEDLKQLMKDKKMWDKESRKWLTDDARRRGDEIIEEIAESAKEVRMLKKARKSSRKDHDRVQIEWLKTVLRHEDVVSKKWKIVYMHHSLYSSEDGHTDDPDAEGLRQNLQDIFAGTFDGHDGQRVHLVLSGHSHCFEWLSSRSPGDQDICYVVTGGGGRPLRESALSKTTKAHSADEAAQTRTGQKQDHFSELATSRAFAKRYNFVKVEMTAGKLIVTPVQVNVDEASPDHMSVQRFTKLDSFVPVEGGWSGYESKDDQPLRSIHVHHDRPPTESG